MVVVMEQLQDRTNIVNAALYATEKEIDTMILIAFKTERDECYIDELQMLLKRIAEMKINLAAIQGMLDHDKALCHK